MVHYKNSLVFPEIQLIRPHKMVMFSIASNYNV